MTSRNPFQSIRSVILLLSPSSAEESTKPGALVRQSPWSATLSLLCVVTKESNCALIRTNVGSEVFGHALKLITPSCSAAKGNTQNEFCSNLLSCHFWSMKLSESCLRLCSASGHPLHLKSVNLNCRCITGGDLERWTRQKKNAQTFKKRLFHT